MADIPGLIAGLAICPDVVMPAADNQMLHRAIANLVGIPLAECRAGNNSLHYIADSDPVEDAAPRVKRILDAKYDNADIEKICEEQAELDEQQRAQLAVLLCKYKALFDGQLGHWHGQEVKLELQEGANQSFSLLLTHLLQLFVPANSSSTLCLLFDKIILYYCKVSDLLKGQSNRAVIWIKKLTDYSCITAVKCRIYLRVKVIGQ